VVLRHFRVNFLVSFYIFRKKRYSSNMRTIRDALSSVIESTPFLESALADGILNLTAFARRIRPEVEANLLRPVSVGSLVMAMKRLVPKLESTSSSAAVPWGVGDLTVRSNRVDLLQPAVAASDTGSHHNQRRILHLLSSITLYIGILILPAAIPPCIASVA